MRKRFVTKKRKKFKIKMILFIATFLVSFYYIFNLLINVMLIEPIINSDTILKIGLSNTTIKYKAISPRDLLYLSTDMLLGNEVKETQKVQAIDTSKNDKSPIVYIYNTHDTESYASHLLEAYNISFTVKTASFILRDNLREYGIPCFVETESMQGYLHNNNLKYKDSYKASRFYLQKRIEEYPSIKLFIDLHRDSARKSATTVEIDGKSYAKVLFVVGLDYPNNESNVLLAEKLNSMVDARLTRGISRKTGNKVNGIYNQDVTNNIILLEVGGQDNTIEEVNNTLKKISLILFNYMESM